MKFLYLLLFIAGFFIVIDRTYTTMPAFGMFITFGLGFLFCKMITKGK